MTRASPPSYQLSACIGDELVVREVPPPTELIAMLRRGEIWAEASVYPKAAQFPCALLTFHEGHGFVVQCYEDEQSWSDFLTASDRLSLPDVEIELGGQALERWPRELFVPDQLATDALQWFLDFGNETPGLHWVRIDRFPRQIVWEGREEREAWEQSRQRRDEGGA